MPKKPTVKAHRGFIHIPRRGRGPRRPPRFPGFPGFPRFPGFPGFPRFPGIGGPRRPIRQPVRPPRGPIRQPVEPPKGPFRPKRPIGDPRPEIRRDPKKLKDFMRRQREQQRAADNFRRLRDAAFRRSTSAQRRAKGGAMVKPKDYVNPSSTIDRRKKK